MIVDCGPHSPLETKKIRILRVSQIDTYFETCTLD